MIGDYFSYNGELLPVSRAVVSVDDLEFTYGFGVYENLKLRNGILYFADQHVARMEESARVIGITASFKRADVLRFLTDLVKKNTVETANIKMLLIGGTLRDKARLFIFLLNPKFPDRKLYKAGAAVISYRHERLFPQAKTLNMLGSFLAYSLAKQNECYDALLIDKTENLLEGTRTNFYAMNGNTIFTAPKPYILEGVTRKTVLYTAEKEGYKIVERLIHYDEVSSYESVFLTSTSSNILPVRKIDEIVFPMPSDPLKALMRAYDIFLKESGGIFNENKTPAL